MLFYRVLKLGKKSVNNGWGLRGMLFYRVLKRKGKPAHRITCLRGMLFIGFLNSHKKTCLKERRRQKIMKSQKKYFFA